MAARSDYDKFDCTLHSDVYENIWIITSWLMWKKMGALYNSLLKYVNVQIIIVATHSSYKLRNAGNMVVQASRMDEPK